MLSRLALWAIRLYQRHLSPLKGFSCAYRVATGGASCSAYGYRAIERHGLLAGLALLDRRLQRCGEVHRDRIAGSAPARNPLLHYQRGDCDCGGCDVGDLPGCDCGGGDCGRSRDRPGRRCEPFQRWREKRWNANISRLQQERLERKRRERYQRERRGDGVD
ncbi:membrane protein insertion efficiency factor YidD [Massilia sp. 9I]|uniref:membrane protein insertion efficiency factor YidD n=1 Tax=Massilia sp. 9I TaxID=2653152 RepID=UPI001E2B6EB3|nr:membrane protein insertion efficiency factor YidD [Massilia sp. 9I]